MTRPQLSFDEIHDRLPRPLAWFVDFMRDLVRESVDDRINGLAAEMAFFGLLGVFPALLIMAALLGSLDSLVGSAWAERAESAMINGLDRVLTDQASGAVDAIRALFEGERGGLVTFATIGAIWAVSRSFAAVILALDHAYDLVERRTWVKQRLVGAALALGTLATTIIVLSMIVVGPLFGGGRAVAGNLGFGGFFAFAWNWLRFPFAFAFLTAWATTIFDLGPAIRTKWKWQIPGAVFVAVSWLGLSVGFSVYLRLAGGSNPVFGILGGGLILMLWMYLLSLALLLGAEVNAILIIRRKGSVEAVAA
ncbi:MAG: YihY/virulence factor BrkB family protein [Acidimicrobiales bacterium]